MEMLSKWLAKNLDDHAIVDSESFREELLKDTGCDAPWATSSYTQMKRAVDARGLGGWISEGLKGRRVTDAECIVTALARKYAAGYTGSPYQGRGRTFSHAVEALQKAGH